MFFIIVAEAVSTLDPPKLLGLFRPPKSVIHSKTFKYSTNYVATKDRFILMYFQMSVLDKQAELAIFHLSCLTSEHTSR